MEESEDGQQNPEHLGNADSSYPTDTASPRTNRKAHKARKNNVPWTAEDYWAYRESKKHKQLAPRPELSVGAYAFLFDDLEEGLIYLLNGVAPEDYRLPESNAPNKGPAYTDPPVSRTVLPFKGTPTPEPKTTEDDSYTSVHDEYDIDQIPSPRWNWDPGGTGDITPDDPRGPAPYTSMLVASVTVTDEAKDKPGSELTTDDLNIHSWKNKTTTQKVAQPMIFRGTFNGINANILYDNGSGGLLMGKSFAQSNNIPTQQLNPRYRLRYGDSKSSLTDQETVAGKVHIGSVVFTEQFLINPHDLPGIDIILGKNFQDRVGCEILNPKGREPYGKAYVQFPGGEKIYTQDDLLGGMEVNLNYIDSFEAHSILKREMKANGSLSDIEFYKVSVQKEAQMNGDIPSTEATIKPRYIQISRNFWINTIFYVRAYQ